MDQKDQNLKLLKKCLPINISELKKDMDCPKQDNLPIKLKDKQNFDDLYDIINEIGQGAHAIVKTGILKNDPAKTIYAIKIMRTGDPEIIKTVNKKILLYTILRLFKTFLMHQN